jgi:hypothetical protein
MKAFKATYTPEIYSIKKGGFVPSEEQAEKVLVIKIDIDKQLVVFIDSKNKLGIGSIDDLTGCQYNE